MADVFKNRANHIIDLLDALDETKKDKYYYNFAKAFCNSDNEIMLIKKFYRSNNCLLREIEFDNEMLSDDATFECMELFLKWCNFTLENEIEKIFTDKQYYGPREQQIIKFRFQRWTLDDIGTELNLTRERIRQLEKNITRKFGYYFNRKEFLKKIIAELDGKNVLEFNDIEKLTHNHAEELFYILFKMSSKLISYCKKYNVLVIYDIDKVEKIVKYLTELPNDISEGEISLISEFCKNEKIDVHVFYCLFNLEYELIDKTYKKRRLQRPNLLHAKSQNPKVETNRIEIEKDLVEDRRKSIFLTELDLVLKEK